MVARANENAFTQNGFRDHLGNLEFVVFKLMYFLFLRIQVGWDFFIEPKKSYPREDFWILRIWKWSPSLGDIFLFGWLYLLLVCFWGDVLQIKYHGIHHHHGPPYLGEQFFASASKSRKSKEILWYLHLGASLKQFKVVVVWPVIFYMSILDLFWMAFRFFPIPNGFLLAQCDCGIPYKVGR